ncbi:MAG: hypothetical protein AB1305_04670, partial [Candidatus Hadarchaeota archaeon]
KISDRTAQIRVSLWNELAGAAERVKIGDVVRLVDAYSSPGQFESIELHLGKAGRVEVNPQGAEVPPLNELQFIRPAADRKTVAELDREGVRGEVRGTIVQVFHRRPVFDVCPNCGRGLGSSDANPICGECGKAVVPEQRVVLSFLLDDGTGNIRVALFGKAVEQLLGMDGQKLFQSFKSTPDIAKFYDGLGLVGREVVVSGATKHDKYFDQLELRGYGVEAAEPEGETRRLLKWIKGET